MKDHTKDKSTRTGRENQDVNRSTSENRTHKGGNNPYLDRLKDLDDYQVASDDPDVRGWTVISGDNEKVGKVDELIVDTKRMKVRYLVVEANEDLGYKKGEDSLLVPIGAARLHEKNNDVIVSSLTKANTRNYPVFRGDNVSREHENSIRRFYEAGGTVPASSGGAHTSEEETIRDAHTGKTYARKDQDDHSSKDRGPVSEVDSHNKARVDVVTGTSGDEKSADQTPGKSEQAHGKGKISSTPQENRASDRSLADSNTLRGKSSDKGFTPENNDPLGNTFNHTSRSDLRDRMGTSGISSSRTSNLPNKDLEQGPSSKKNKDFSEDERVRIHDTDPNVKASKDSSDTNDADFNETGDMNRSTSLGNDSRRGSNMGNLEDKEGNAGIDDRSRTSATTGRSTTPGSDRHPERYSQNKPVDKKDLTHSSDELPDDRYDPETDEFYTHDHFDEDRFYGNRRNKDK